MIHNSHIVIIGGGLAGLTSAIHLAKMQIPVTLIEKETYPKHKVCGEYISNEVVPYLDFLGIKLKDLEIVGISQLQISTKNGKLIKSKLPLGGFGVSRYRLDHHLWITAKKLGVQLINDQVINVDFQRHTFLVHTSNNGIFYTDYVIGAYGKRSILDKNLHRDFSQRKSPWLAVKAHYVSKFDSDTVALHNFEGGYCGLSVVENKAVNACYLVNYESFKKYKDIVSFEKNILYENPYLKDFFENSEMLFRKHITISQINFDPKKPVEKGVFMIGDAAGLIHPLCGNGMAMAIQSAKVLCDLFVANHASIQYSRQEMELMYAKEWNKAFSKRLYAGRVLQKVLLHNGFQQIAQKVAKTIPAIVPEIIKQTHGKPLVCS